jgi:hypothetical protein
MNVQLKSIEVIQSFIEDHGYEAIEKMQNTVVTAIAFVASQSSNPDTKPVFLPEDAENLLCLHRLLGDTKKSISSPSK